MSQKKRVAVIFGGQSAEHQVSLQSAKNIIEAMDKTKFEPVLVAIDKQGQWHGFEQANFLLHAEDPKLIALNKSSSQISLSPGNAQQALTLSPVNPSSGSPANSAIDIVFPIVHGTIGEDGALQGMLRTMNLPFVGSSVLGSAVCMDKDVAKRLLQAAGLPIAAYLCLRKHLSIPDYAEVTAKLGDTVFVKPANMGSSVGVSKVRSQAEYEKAVALAFKFDTKILLEEAIKGREIEIAVLGNNEPVTSAIGEIAPSTDFYSYESKYIDEKGATLIVPAKLDSEKAKQVAEYAVRAFTALECAGLARVDFFLQEDGKLVINEINTLPGFTKISMYPKLFGEIGIGYSDLITRLLTLAEEKFAENKQLKISME